MKKPIVLLISIMLLALRCPTVTFSQNISMPIQNLQRSMSILDATMTRSFRGTPENFYMVDVCDIDNDEVSGPSDVWPYTAAIEAHCSVLEALECLKEEAPSLYADHHDRYVQQLNVLIDNLAYYRGSYNLTSYATRKTWTVYAVPRANEAEKGDVAGGNLTFNVYDDQMWLARELVRAYRLTGNESYLQEATNLTDYVLDGWDCWRDAAGEEYGGITWGPGYNSKHSCSNGPIIQPLVWLYDIYNEIAPQSSVTYYYRDMDNQLTNRTVTRCELYLDFAQRIYAWQKRHLLNTSTGVYWDMLGANNILQYEGSGATRRRAHVDTGEHVGEAFTYNTGTMLAGAVELFRATGERGYQDDIESLSVRSYNAFTKPKRIDGVIYQQWPTDENALQGFNTWFNNVLMRAYIDADLTGVSPYSTRSLESFQINLDYAFEHYLRNNLLPIDLLSGWDNSTKTKGFHQASFVSEYAMLAVWQQRKIQVSAIQHPSVGSQRNEHKKFSLAGHQVRTDKNTLPRGIYISDGRKVLVK